MNRNEYTFKMRRSVTHLVQALAHGGQLQQALLLVNIQGQVRSHPERNARGRALPYAHSRKQRTAYKQRVQSHGI